MIDHLLKSTLVVVWSDSDVGPPIATFVHAILYKKSFKWSFQSVLNRRFPRGGVNKSVCIDLCKPYAFSTRPSRQDFAMIQDFLVPEKMTVDQYRQRKQVFHTDVEFQFESMDSAFEKFLILKSDVTKSINQNGDKRVYWVHILCMIKVGMWTFPSWMTVKGFQKGVR